MKWVLRHMAALAVLVSVFVAQVAVADQQTSTEPAVLYWMVAADAKVNDNGIELWVEEVRSRPGGHAVDGAVVHVEGPNIGAGVYLNLLDSSGSVSDAVAIGLEWNAAADGFTAGPAMSQIQAAWQKDGTTFTMELGYYEGDNWVVMAKSAGETWNELVASDDVSFDDINPAHLHWAPSVFVVPEPSSGLLLLIGSALLALRRKRVNPIA